MRKGRTFGHLGLLSSLAIGLATGCDRAPVPEPAGAVQLAYSEPVREPASKAPVVEGRSDCAPGAPPSSLANAIDVMRVHCDRDGAVGALGALAGVALTARFAGARLGGAAAGRAVASEIMAAEAGAAPRTLLTGARAAAPAAEAIGSEDETGETFEIQAAEKEHIQPPDPMPPHGTDDYEEYR